MYTTLKNEINQYKYEYHYRLNSIRKLQDSGQRQIQIALLLQAKTFSPTKTYASDINLKFSHVKQ